MNEQESMAILEGLLFLWGDPLEVSEMARVLEVSEGEVRKILRDMADEFDHSRRGLVLRQYGDAWQLTSREEHRPYMEKLLARPKNYRLTNSALETLAIVAYRQPVTRVEIDNIRGVKSSSALSGLEDKGYIEEAGRLDAVGRPILYRTTRKFLQHFNLESLDQLPDFDQTRARLEAEEAGEDLDLLQIAKDADGHAD